MAFSEGDKDHRMNARSVKPIGLFPLELVAFPGSYIPLYIFEERYKALVNDCVAEDKPFAINYSSGKKIHDFGCVVRVSEIIKVHDKGEMNIVVVGTERGCLTEMIDGEKDYLMGMYETYEPEEKDFSSSLLHEITNLYNKIVRSVDNPIMTTFEYEDLSRLINPSFILSQKAGLSLQEKQAILAKTFENDRLEIIKKHLVDVMPFATKSEKIQRVIKNNGYIGPKGIDLG